MDQASFLDRVRASLRAGGKEALPERPAAYRTPEPGERAELVERFVEELEAVGGVVHRAGSLEEARVAILRILAEREARRVVRGATSPIRELELDGPLEDADIEVTVADLDDEAGRSPLRDAAFEADAGITSAEYGIAETGTLALMAGPGQGRAVSLLPPVHIAVLHTTDVVAELAALFERAAADAGDLPSALTFVTGPSRTGDIELVLTVGVHGPKELHVVLLAGEPGTRGGTRDGTRGAQTYPGL